MRSLAPLVVLAAACQRDVEVVTGAERLWLPDALRIVPVEPALEDVALSIFWEREREGTDRGETVVDGRLQVIFFVPLEPFCGGSPTPPRGHPGAEYDSLAYQVDDRPRYAGRRCPPPLTVDAGPFVTLEGDGVSIRLDRTRDRFDRIVYLAHRPDAVNVPLAASLDLVTEGEGRIPAFVLPGVVETPGFDVALLDRPGRVHDRTEPLTITWEASDYPNDRMFLELHGRDRASDAPAWLSALPWNDGAYTIDPADLSRLHPGPLTLVAYAEQEGPRVEELPFSDRSMAGVTVTRRATQPVVVE